MFLPILTLKLSSSTTRPGRGGDVRRDPEQLGLDQENVRRRKSRLHCLCGVSVRRSILIIHVASNLQKMEILEKCYVTLEKFYDP